MKKVIGIISIIVISLFVLTGCTSPIVIETETENSVNRFERVFIQDESEIIYDRETKVQYLLRDVYYGHSITVLVDAEGKPLLYEGE